MDHNPPQSNTLRTSPPPSPASEKISNTPDTPNHEEPTSVTSTPKFSEKTVAQFRQRFEQQPPSRIDNRFGRSMLPNRGYRGSVPVISTSMPVLSSAIGEGHTDNSATTEGYVLPALTFDPVSELPTNDTYPSQNTKSPSLSNDLETLRSTMYVAKPSPHLSTKEARPTTSSSNNTNNARSSSQDLAWIQDGISIVDFAYMHTAPSSMLSPMDEEKYIRLLSKFERAHESKSGRSSTSTQRPTHLEEWKLGRETSVSGTRTEKLNQCSSEETLHLLPTSIYMPPERCEDPSSSTEDLLLLPASVYTPLDS